MTKWKDKQDEWKNEVRKAGFAIDALEDHITDSLKKFDFEWGEKYICLLYLVLLGYSIASAARMMGWKTSKTVTENCSRSVFKAIGYLKNPQNPQTVKWNEIVEVCRKLRYYDLEGENFPELKANNQKLKRENSLLKQDIDKFSKFLQQEKININCQDFSEEERKEIEALIKRLFGI